MITIPNIKKFSCLVGIVSIPAIIPILGTLLVSKNLKYYNAYVFIRNNQTTKL